MVNCKYSTVRERDMDLLFLELLATDAGFVDLLVSRAELIGKPLVKSIELSRSDAELGESDITAVIAINGKDYGFLIEDKVDAAAQPNQYERYKKRGEKGVKAGEFSEDRIFIFFIIKNCVILNNNNVGSPLQLLHDTYFFLNILWKCTIVRHYG